MDDAASTKSGGAADGSKKEKKQQRSETVTPASDPKEVKTRSRARSLWGRKKSTT